MSLPKATFYRNSEAYNVQGVKVLNNIPRFVNGYRGKGILIEEATTNLCPNGSFENTPLSWTLSANMIISEENPFWGNKCLKFYSSSPAAGQSSISARLSVSPNTTYTLSAKLFNQLTAGRFYIDWIELSSSNLILVDGAGVQSTLGKGAWEELSCTFTTTANTTQIDIRIVADIGPIGTGYADCIQLEKRSYATSYTDGAREAEGLIIPTPDVFNAPLGTIEMTIKPLSIQDYNEFLTMFVGFGRFKLWFDKLKNVYWDYGQVGNPLVAYNAVKENEFIHIALTWDDSIHLRELYVNGLFDAWDIFFVAPSQDVISSDFNLVDKYSAVIDNFRVSNIRRTPQEIKAGYYNYKHLPVDQYTTFALEFEDSVEQTWIPMEATWTKDDYYNADDINKVEFNTAAAVKQLTDIMYKVPIAFVNTERDTSSIDLISSINRVENNIELIKNNFRKPSGWQNKQVWDVGKGFTYQDANRLENNLNLLYSQVQNAKDNLIYNGTFSCGTDWEGGLY